MSYGHDRKWPSIGSSSLDGAQRPHADGGIVVAATYPGKDIAALKHITWANAVVAGAVLLGVCARLAVFMWSDPWGPHHPDEHILPLEAIALWEGVTPREIGWPASTSRLALSATAAVDWLVHDGRAAWQRRSEPDQALETVTNWIAHQYVYPDHLYQLGRTVSILTGVLALIAGVWALRQWVAPFGTSVGTLALAISPLLVAYSQYVLGDVAAVLFALIVVGLAARPAVGRVMGMSAFVGLAASSKFSYGLWLLTPLLCVWLGLGGTALRRKLWLSFGVVATCSVVVLALVPWIWTNPLLAFKEFAGTVLVKVGSGSAATNLGGQAGTIFAGMGMVAWLGAAIQLAMLRVVDLRRLAPVLTPVLLGTAILLLSATVFDRYGLVLLPGVVLLSAMGWERGRRHAQQAVRAALVPALVICLAVTLARLIQAERRIGQTDVDVQANEWILKNVPRGARVAVHDEANAYLPRTVEQLRSCVAYVDTAAAYGEKWLTEGVPTTVEREQPMQSVVLNDERFYAYWCRRELDAQQDSGFYVVPYHEVARFGAVLERDAIRDFRDGSRESTGGIDVLVLNRPVDVGLPPRQIFRSDRGQRAIYARVGGLW